MNTPKVQYGYADGSANHVCPASVTYPNGRVLSYDYGTSGGTDDAASRIAALIDDDGTSHLADYSYLGLGTVVVVDYTQPDVKYTLVHLSLSNDPDTGDIYSGLDRFDRVKDSRWHHYAGSADVDRIKYGYDRAGNRLWRENVVAAANDADFDELYRYDGLYRLKDFDRGRLNATKDGLSTMTFAQEWSLDPTGNWSNFKEDQDGDATWDLDQTRASNRVNEITDLTETAGPAWVTPAHDRAGNMVTIPKPADPMASLTATYDAWNRPVKLTDTGSTVEENEYDGRGYRTVRKSYTGGTLDETRHVYYMATWQTAEERLDSATAAERQFVWGVRYIDDLIVRDRDTVGDGTLDERLYAAQDANWNVTGVTDATGAVAERYAYQAYGQARFLSSQFGSRNESSFDWATLFAGYHSDNPTGLYTVRNRDLHPRLGAWSQRDPIGLPATENLYEYTDSDPINATDSAGLKCKFHYRPGKGRFDLVSFTDASSARPGEVSTQISLQWRPRQPDFRNSECCEKVGFIQIVELEAWYDRRNWLHRAQGAGYHPWALDGGIPYPTADVIGNTTVNPLEVPARLLSMVDNPGAQRRVNLFFDAFLLTYVHSFETCVVCLDNLTGTGAGRNGDRHIVVYGCIEWGHSFTRRSIKAGARESFVRYIKGGTRTVTTTDQTQELQITRADNELGKRQTRRFERVLCDELGGG